MRSSGPNASVRIVATAYAPMKIQSMEKAFGGPTSSPIRCRCRFYWTMWPKIEISHPSKVSAVIIDNTHINNIIFIIVHDQYITMDRSF